MVGTEVEQKRHGRGNHSSQTDECQLCSLPCNGAFPYRTSPMIPPHPPATITPYTPTISTIASPLHGRFLRHSVPRFSFVVPIHSFLLGTELDTRLRGGACRGWSLAGGEPVMTWQNWFLPPTVRVWTVPIPAAGGTEALPGKGLEVAHYDIFA